MRKLIYLLVFAGVALPLQAQDFSYDYLEGGYTHQEIRFDSNNPGIDKADIDIGAIRFSSHYNDTVLIQVEAFHGEFDDATDSEITGFSSSLGGVVQITKSASLNGGVGFGYLEGDTSDEDYEETRFFVFFGGRQWLAPNMIELFGGLHAIYTDPDDSNLDSDTFGKVEVGVRGYVTPDLSVAGSYATTFGRDDRDDDLYSINVRWRYGE